MGRGGGLSSMPADRQRCALFSLRQREILTVFDSKSSLENPIPIVGSASAKQGMLFPAACFFPLSYLQGIIN